MPIDFTWREEKVKVVSTDVKLIGDELVVEGLTTFGELMERAQREEPLVRQGSLTAGLPDEDLSPGHVMPAVVLTKLAPA